MGRARKKNKDKQDEVTKQKTKTRQQLLLEVEDLRVRIRETKKLLSAIKRGEVDTASFPIGAYTRRGADHLYRLIFGNINEGALIVFSGGSILYCNKRFSELVEKPLPKVVGSRIFEFIPTEDVSGINAMLQACGDERYRQGEFNLKTDKGKLIPIRFSMAPVLGTKGVNCAVITDLADYKRREEELKKLTSELMAAQEKERKRIAGELHDSLGALLSAIKFKVEDLLQKGHGQVLEESVKTAVKMIGECIADVRRIQTDLRPPMLDDLGVSAALKWYCRQFDTTYPNIHIETHLGIEEDEVPNTLKTTIFRVSQEALNNVAKHSKATNVALSLQKGNGMLELTIQDNGQGFNMEDVFSRDRSGNGLGLTSMRERVELSDGSFSIESRIGEGTIIRVSWPLA